jgi:lysophospholipase L1-like esterase
MAAVRLVRHKLQLFALLVAVGVFGGCETPTGPPPPPPPGPTIACPTDISVSSDTGEPLPVHFELPSTTTQNPPVAVKCSPEPDSEFPVGSNAVVCTAVDTVGQSSCGFMVAVSLPERRLKFTKFLAFGDSITQGFLRELPDFEMSFTPQFLDPVQNYPFKLEQMLRQRYGSSEIVVINEGLGGETVLDGADRIVDVLAMHKPQVVLILEGYNELREIPISAARSALRGMARWAQVQGVEPVLATLHQVGDDREEQRPGSQDVIDDLNDAIRGLGQSLGLGGVADLENAFGRDRSLLGTDGLHPNPAGYQRMAETFRDEIIRRFEEIPPPAPPAPSRAPSAQHQFSRRSGH